MKSLGIDIGSSSIKIVEINSNNKGIQITRFMEHTLSVNTIQSESDSQLEIIEFLRTIASSYDPQNTTFVVGMGQDKVSVRNKIFPFTERLKIIKSLPFELEEELPFSNDTAIYDAKVIHHSGSTAEVLACATPKNRIQKVLDLMQDSNIDLSILSAEGLAYANCFEKWFESIPNLPATQVAIDESQRPERLIHVHVVIGHTRTLVCAVENNQLIGTRCILWGGKNIIDSIVKRYEIPAIEAIKEMQTKAFILPSKEGASYDQIVFSDTVSLPVKELARELQISILEFKSEFNGHIQSVGLTGGVSGILNIHAFLTQMLDLPVNKLNVLQNFHTTFEKTPAIDAKIGVALGLAIEGLKKPRNPALNFLRGEFAKQNTHLKAFWDQWGFSLQIAATAFVLFFAYSSARTQLSLSLADRTGETLKVQAKAVAKLPVKSQNENGVKKYIREQKTRITELKTLSNLAHMNSAMDVLKKINDAIPAKNIITLDVKKINVIEDQAEIEGVVLDAKQIDLLQTALANISVGKVNRKTVSQNPSVGSPGVAFAFSFKVDRSIQSK